MTTLSIAWLLEETVISGLARVVLAQADALAGRGHSIRIVTKGMPVTWRHSRAEWVYVSDLHEYQARDDDFVIGTSWQTLQAASDLAPGRARHLCCKDERAGLQDAAAIREVEAAWALPLPKLALTPALAEIARAFVPDVTCVGRIVDDVFFRSRTPPEHEPPRILLSGASHVERRGIDDGYGAVAHARWFRHDCSLIRVSPWAPSREEPLDDVQEFHVSLTTAEMARLLHSCDVLVGPAHAAESLALPVAEALAAGIPTVLTSVPAHTGLGPEAGFACFAPERNAVELGEALIRLLTDEVLRERLRGRGREVAENWRSERAGERLEAALRGRIGTGA